MNSVTSSFKCQSYKGFLQPGCKDIGIRKYACVAKTHFLSMHLKRLKLHLLFFVFDFLAFEVFIIAYFCSTFMYGITLDQLTFS